MNIKNHLLILLSLFLTISVYLTDLIIITLFIVWLVEGGIKKKIYAIKDDLLIISTLIFLLYFLLSYFWSEANIFNFITQKQILILLLPVLYTSQFHKSYVKKAKYAFIIGVFTNVLLSTFTFFYPTNILFKTGHYANNLFAHGFLDHFDYSIFLCFSIFLLISLMAESRYYYLHACLILVFFVALLNSYGRVGIISFIIFFPIIILKFKNRNFKYLLVIIFVILTCCSYYIFPPFQERVNQTYKNISLLISPLSFEEKLELDAEYLANQNKHQSKDYYIKQIRKDQAWMNDIKNKKPEYNTSLGRRYIYARNSFQLIKERPIFGNGANQFAQLYQKKFDDPNVLHPHNNFIFILVELGVVGLIMVIGIFSFQMKTFFQNNSHDFMQMVLPMLFIIIMFFDNYFLNHNTLTFWCLFTFILFDKKINNKYA